MLLLHVTCLLRSQIYAAPDRVLTPEQNAAYELAIERRLHHEPIQYITGEQEFFGLPLQVTPAVLIPRPETEHLVEAVLAEFAPEPSLHISIVDVGTGSGAIAIALAKHLPNARVTALDISPAAIAIASANAERHDVAGQIRFVESDLLNALPERNALDVIVSNPPYVAETDRNTLHPQVREFEPAAALFAGEDGLAIYRRLVPQALAVLKPGGLLAIEIGHDQRDAIAALLSDWRDVRFINDLQQIPRVALSHRP